MEPLFLLLIVPAIILMAHYGGKIFARRAAPSTPAEIADIGRRKDCDAVNQGKCPDCGAEGTLLQGPSGGMSQNIGCDACLMEFNIGFGFGTGAFVVDRTGKMGMSRASVFGISPEEYANNPNSEWRKV